MKSIIDCTKHAEIEWHNRYVERMFERIYEWFKDSHDIHTNDGCVIENILALQELLDAYDYKNGCDIYEKFDQFAIRMYGQTLKPHEVVLYKD